MSNVFDQFDQKSESNVFDQFDSQPKDQQQDERGVVESYVESDPFFGAAENLLSFATGSIAEPVAGLSGIAASLFGGSKSGAEAVEGVQEALTYQPRTQLGQQTQQNVGQALAPVGEALQTAEQTLGDVTYDITGSPALAAGAATLPTAALELLGVRGARGARRIGPDVPDAPVRTRDGRLADTNIRATRGEQLQAQRSPEAFDQLKQEQYLLEQSGEAGDDLRSFKRAQSQEIEDYLRNTTPETQASVGESVKNALELRNNSARFKRKQAYDKLAELTSDTNVGLNTQVIGDTLPEAGELRDFAATSPGQFQAISTLLGEFGVDATPSTQARLANQGINVTPLSVANAERFRVRLNNIESADPTGNTARITGPIKRALDEEFDIAAKALEAQGSEDVARAAKNARQSHIALKTEFDEKGMVDRLIAPSRRGSQVPKIEESQVYTKLVANSTPIEQFDSVVKSLDRAGSKGRMAKNAIKSQMVLDLIDSGFNAGSRKVQGDRIFGTTAFNKRFDQLKPKLKSVLSKEEFARLEKLRKNTEDLVPPSGSLPKGSAGFFIDALNGAGMFALLDKIPGAGPVVAEQVKMLGRKSQDAKAVRRALQNPKTKETFDLLQTDYPALFTALGLSQVKQDEEEQ